MQGASTLTGGLADWRREHDSCVSPSRVKRNRRRRDGWAGLVINEGPTRPGEATPGQVASQSVCQLMEAGGLPRTRRRRRGGCQHGQPQSSPCKRGRQAGRQTRVHARQTQNHLAHAPVTQPTLTPCSCMRVCLHLLPAQHRVGRRWPYACARCTIARPAPARRRLRARPHKCACRGPALTRGFWEGSRVRRAVWTSFVLRSFICSENTSLHPYPSLKTRCGARRPPSPRPPFPRSYAHDTSARCPSAYPASPCAHTQTSSAPSFNRIYVRSRPWQNPSSPSRPSRASPRA